MATNLNIDLAPLLKLAKVFSPATRQRILGVVGKRVGAAMESVIPDYPPPSGKPLPKIYTRRRADGSSYLSAFKSMAQQRKVFALLKQGAIPFKRTGLLGRSFTSTITELLPSSVTITLGTAIKYAPLVVGDDTQQALYHKGHWWQLIVVMQSNQALFETEATQTLAKEVAKELKS